MDTKFFDYCVKTGVISQQDLHKVLESSDDSVSIYETLIHSNVITQEQLAVSAGEYYQCPVVDLSKITPEPNATAYGTSQDCRRLHFVPFAVDPVAGVLVALVDYSQLSGVKSFLKSARIERMKFYLAPYDTLIHMIDQLYGPPANEVAPKRLRRTTSLIQLQTELDIQSQRKQDLSSMFDSASSDDRRLKAMAFELAACREENNILRQRVEQLSTAVELEANMLRELGRILKASGVLTNQDFEQWLFTQR